MGQTVERVKEKLQKFLRAWERPGFTGVFALVQALKRTGNLSLKGWKTADRLET